MRRELRLLIVDDHSGYSEFLEEYSDIWNEQYEVILSHVESAAEAVEQLSELKPNVIMVDAHLPDMNSLEFVQQFSTVDSAIVVTSEKHSLSLEESAMCHGADAYIPKTQDPDEIEFLFSRLAQISSDPRELH